MNNKELIKEINLERVTISLGILRGMRKCDKYEDKYLNAQALLIELIELIEES